MDEPDSDYAHHEVRVEFVNPKELVVDEVNERKTNTGPRTEQGNLEKSIEESGIENLPQVRPKESGDGYKVFAGQRRVQAAQAVGLSEIPVIVKDLDDTEALAASVNENNEYLKKDVPRKDRAEAVEELSREWELDRVADHFGVQKQTIRNWMEPTRDFWEGTIFDPSVDTEIETEYIADDLLADLRRVMDDSEHAERVAQIVIQNQIPANVVRSAINETDSPGRFIESLKKQWKAYSAGKEQIRPQITLTGEDAEKLEKWAKSRGISKEEATKKLVIEQLESIFD